MLEHFLNFLKFILALIVIPISFFLSESFRHVLIDLPEIELHSFLFGIALYVAIHLLVFEPQGLYLFGQRLLEKSLGFYPPLASIISRALPIYAVILGLGCWGVSLFYRNFEFESVVMFFLGFTLSLHLTFFSKELRESDNSLAKSNYLLFIQLEYFLIVLILSTIFIFLDSDFSFGQFFLAVFESVKTFYVDVYRKLFVPH